MKTRFITAIIFSIVFILSSCRFVPAQNLNKISTRCQSPYQSNYSSVFALGNGNITHTPCPTKASIFTGIVDFTGTTITGLFPVTTKGDLFTFSTVPDRLGVGANNSVLIANSAQTTGLQWVTAAPLATSLAGGLGGQLPYQSGAGVTAFLANGTAGQVLQSNGTTLAPSWVAASSGTVTGTGTTNRFTRWTNGAGGVLGDIPASWDGSLYQFSNTAFTSTFPMALNPTTGSGTFAVGDTGNASLDLAQGAGTVLTNAFTSITNEAPVHSWNNLAGTSTFPMSYISTSGSGVLNVGQANVANIVATQSTSTVSVVGNSSVRMNSRGGFSKMGDTDGVANNTVFQITDASSTFDFQTLSGTGVFDLDSILNHKLFRTITAGGTTGNQTINKPNGTVNFAAGASAITVTNSTVGTSSLINALAQTNDATCAVKNAVAGAGSFVINMTANCTAETRVAFWVTN